MEVIIKEAGNRLDKSLTELSRSQANEAIKAGTVLVNGKSAKAKYVVKEGDVITYVLPEEEVLEYKAEDIPLDIIYEDADVAVVNKPQGMVVHPSAGHTSGTLVNALMYHVKDLSSINGVVRPGIVHRIDKDTSGLLMIAKNDKAHNALAAELKDKKSLRKYVAIVHGNLPNDRGVIEAPIGRSDKDRKNQIRVHMAYIGHPVAGDPLYGPRKTLKGHGQFLHAKTLGFTHPTTGKLVEFNAEEPIIFKETLEKLRKA